MESISHEGGVLWQWSLCLFDYLFYKCSVWEEKWYSITNPHYSETLMTILCLQVEKLFCIIAMQWWLCEVWYKCEQICMWKAKQQKWRNIRQPSKWRRKENIWKWREAIEESLAGDNLSISKKKRNAWKWRRKCNEDINDYLKMKAEIWNLKKMKIIQLFDYWKYREIELLSLNRKHGKILYLWKYGHVCKHTLCIPSFLRAIQMKNKCRVEKRNERKVKMTVSIKYPV